MLSKLISVYKMSFPWYVDKILMLYMLELLNASSKHGVSIGVTVSPFIICFLKTFTLCWKLDWAWWCEIGYHYQKDLIALSLLASLNIRLEHGIFLCCSRYTLKKIDEKNFRTYYNLDFILRHDVSVNLEAYQKKKFRKGCFSRWAKIVLKSKWWSSETLQSVGTSVVHDWAENVWQG